MRCIVLRFRVSGQVDNPVAVLDQENSKKFLQGSEQDKFTFFKQATDLDRIENVSRAKEIPRGYTYYNRLSFHSSCVVHM